MKLHDEDSQAFIEEALYISKDIENNTKVYKWVYLIKLFLIKEKCSEQEIKIDQADYLDLFDNKTILTSLWRCYWDKTEKLKLEYKIVTSYLTDIQKIDRMLPDDRDKVKSSKWYINAKERTDFHEGKSLFTIKLLKMKIRYQEL